MAESFPIPQHILVFLFIISRLITTIGNTKPRNILPSEISTRLRSDHETIKSVSVDYGHIVNQEPTAVLYPSSTQDIATLIKQSYNNNNNNSFFHVAARGRGHSVRGQSMARDGVVVEMQAVKGIKVVAEKLYADVAGGELWIDVLKATLQYGVAPSSWTDYLYLTVGGTLSNAGISGQTFRYGPQISNVYELDVVTG